MNLHVYLLFNKDPCGSATALDPDVEADTGSTWVEGSEVISCEDSSPEFAGVGKATVIAGTGWPSPV